MQRRNSSTRVEINRALTDRWSVGSSHARLCAGVHGVSIDAAAIASELPHQVLTGALMRLPPGTWTYRFGGRIVMTG